MRGAESVEVYDAENPINSIFLHHLPTDIINDSDEKLRIDFFSNEEPLPKNKRSEYLEFHVLANICD